MKKRIPYAYIILVIFGLLFPATGVFAQTTGKIAGHVSDAETGEPLPGVNIVIVGTNQGAATDQDGDYFIINIEPGTYSVRASMIGYAEVTQTGVDVQTSHTTPVDFHLQTQAIAGQSVTIQAQREVVEKDVSSSKITTAAAEVTQQTPAIRSLEDYVGTLAGVEGFSVRGGDVSQTKFMVNGLTSVDNRTNTPLQMVNLSAIKELSVVKGGFSAEYGNLRSGLINVVTKSGSPDKYDATVEFRYTPPHLKHGGISVFDPNNFYLRPYLDPQVAMKGTDQWPEEVRNQYRSFEGWEEYAKHNDKLTPQQALEHFKWIMRVEGSDSLAPAGYGGPPRSGSYGDKPDWLFDGSLGGPVPLLGKHLGNMTFFLSHRSNWEMFAMPELRQYYKDRNTDLKLSSRITPSLRLRIEGMFGVINSISPYTGYSAAHGISYYTNGSANLGDVGGAYNPFSRVPIDIYRNLIGVNLKHVLSDATFYDFSVSQTNITNRGGMFEPWHWRDTTTVRKFGQVPVDEIPYGFDWTAGRVRAVNGMGYNSVVSGWDSSAVSTFNAKFDLTSQVTKTHQLKTGFEFNYDDMSTYGRGIVWDLQKSSTKIKWHHYPWRIGAYLQDKIEFQGLIANVGVRMDYFNPNTVWYNTNRYSKYFTPTLEDQLTSKAENSQAQSHMKISPRLGISHPITENAKLFFNYGHFYSLLPSADLFEINYSNEYRGISFIGNPSADMPRTVAYELGADFGLADMFMLRIAGYYKDITDQAANVGYVGYDRLVNYSTVKNTNYQDIKGFELRLEKRFGSWLTGWVNYDYRVTTSGYIGRRYYYENPMEQRLYGLQNPYQERPLPQPVARANIQLHSPRNFGPRIAGVRPLGGLLLSGLFTYRAGGYFTWDPLSTYELTNNQQWKATKYLDMRIAKSVDLGGPVVDLFLDIDNPFHLKNLNQLGFYNGTDREDYLKSLHLPQYQGEEYQAQGLTPGHDQPGDIKSKDKPYIDMPNRKFLTFTNPTVWTLGIRVNL